MSIRTWMILGALLGLSSTLVAQVPVGDVTVRLGAPQAETMREVLQSHALVPLTQTPRSGTETYVVYRDAAGPSGHLGHVIFESGITTVVILKALPDSIEPSEILRALIRPLAAADHLNLHGCYHGARMGEGPDNPAEAELACLIGSGTHGFPPSTWYRVFLTSGGADETPPGMSISFVHPEASNHPHNREPGS